MCGRYFLNLVEQQLADFVAFMTDMIKLPNGLEPRYNIAPSQPVLSIISDEMTHEKKFTYLSWGLVPRWAKEPSIGNALINARCETVTGKPSFKDAYRYRRCLIPANGYYEWDQRTKQPYAITVPDMPTFAMAGLWEYWADPAGSGSEMASCAIITCEAQGWLGEMHPRMPVILTPDSYRLWLNHDHEVLPLVGTLLEPYPYELMARRAVSRYVSNVRNEGVQCLDDGQEQGTLF
jgi:putative SOS response-associated peptidase YedK